MGISSSDNVLALQAELQAMRQELDDFSSSLAHDLRAPLSAIGAYSQVVEELEGAQLSERGRRYLRRMRAAAAQMSDMTDGLLALAHLSRVTARRERFDLAKEALEVLAPMREREPQRAVAFDVQPGLWVEADRGLARLAMHHLLSNAWKFSAPRRESFIDVGEHQGGGGERVFFVRDNGVGFEMAHAARLFGVFERLHPSTEFEGTGVGLTIVHKVIALHGGRIWADARPRHGATFSFTLG